MKRMNVSQLTKISLAALVSFSATADVVFYESKNFQNEIGILSEGLYTQQDLAELDISIRDISSMLIPSGYSVKGIYHDNSTTSFTSDTSELEILSFSHDIDSIEITYAKNDWASIYAVSNEVPYYLVGDGFYDQDKAINYYFNGNKGGSVCNPKNPNPFDPTIHTNCKLIKGSLKYIKSGGRISKIEFKHSARSEKNGGIRNYPGYINVSYKSETPEYNCPKPNAPWDSYQLKNQIPLYWDSELYENNYKEQYLESDSFDYYNGIGIYETFEDRLFDYYQPAYGGNDSKGNALRAISAAVDRKKIDYCLAIINKQIKYNNSIRFFGNLPGAAASFLHWNVHPMAKEFGVEFGANIYRGIGVIRIAEVVTSYNTILIYPKDLNRSKLADYHLAFWHSHGNINNPDLSPDDYRTYPKRVIRYLSADSWREQDVLSSIDLAVTKEKCILWGENAGVCTKLKE